MAAKTMEEAIDVIKRPFSADALEWRIQRSGIKNDKAWAIVVPYITARAVHDRLDEAFDPWRWRTEFRAMEIPGGESGVICRLWYRNPESDQWDWKENGADQSDIEAFKGGISDSEKRAFEELGGGRYLYALSEMFAETASTSSAKCPFYAKTKEGTVFYWGPPMLPDWAIAGVRAAVQETSKEVLGAEIAERIIYPRFARVLVSLEGKRGITALKAVEVEARKRGWTEEKLFAWAKEQKADLLNGVTMAVANRLRTSIQQVAIPT